MNMKDEESSIENLEILPEHESGVRRLVSDAHGIPYHPLQSFDEAKSSSDGLVILEGNDGSQIYVVGPTSLVKCSEEALNNLLRDLDNIAWPHNDLISARIFYERRPIGSPVFGGMGGATVPEDIWIHQRFIDAGLGDRIREVIEGGRSGIQAAA
jgi:hypothetical protein